MLLLENGRFYAPSKPGISTILIDQGRIIAVAGKNHNLASHYPVTENYNLHGLTVWPGFSDSHIHLVNYCHAQSMVACETETIDACLHRVESAARQAPHGSWVLGHGWNQNIWHQGYGTAQQLDSVSHGHPVFLTSKSLHAAWANSLAMNAASITSATEDPEGGIILRDGCGNPSGIFLEKAVNLIKTVIPGKKTAEIDGAIVKGIHMLHRLGITAIHDFDDLDFLPVYQRLDERDRLNLRILKVIPPTDHARAIDNHLQSGKRFGSIQIGPYKFFMDGALGPHTAALEAPYHDDENNSGLLLYSADDLASRCINLRKFNANLAIHAIGDRAIRLALTVYHAVRKYEEENGLNPARLRIEHVQLISPGYLPELRKLCVTASMQPIHATSDMLMADHFLGNRVHHAYAWKSITDQGIHLIFGSDAPVEDPNPFWGLHAAVTRQRVDGTPGPDGWIPAERIGLHEALAAYTIQPAKEFIDTANNGQFVEGAYADLVVLPCDPFLEKAQNLHQLLPTATMMNGRWVWMDQDMDL